MYKSFFGLKDNPFEVNPNPKFLFLTKQIEEALAGLMYGIETRKGFITLTGEVGTGKTTLVNRLLDWLGHRRTRTAFLFNSRINSHQLFDFILAEFEIPCEIRNKSQQLMKLNKWLLDRYQAGEKAVLIVDEAQNLSHPVLEEIRQNVRGYDGAVAGLLTGGVEKVAAAPANVDGASEAQASTVFSSQDFLFSSGTLGRYCSNLNSCKESKDRPWSSSPNTQTWWYR